MRAVTNLAASFTNMQFIPAGSMNTENIAEFVEAKAVFAVGASFQPCYEAKGEDRYAVVHESCAFHYSYKGTDDKDFENGTFEFALDEKNSIFQ